MSLVRRLAVSLAIIGLLAGNVMSAAGFAPADAGQGPNPVVTVLPDGLNLDWRAAQAQITAVPGESGQASVSRVSIPGFTTLSRPGAPLLPVASTLVALPPGANPSLELVQVYETRAALPAPLALAGKPQGVLRGPDGQALGGEFAPALPAGPSSAPFQPAVLELELLGSARGVQIARLVFYPARQDGGGLLLASRVQAVLHFNRPAGRVPSAPQAAAGPYLKTLQASVANPEQMQPVDVRAGAVRSQAVDAAPGDPQAAAISVDHTGLTAVSYDDLAAAGFPVEGVLLENLHLTRAGSDIPIEWQGDGDPVFEQGERLLFFAEPRPSRYAAADVYWLARADTLATLMESRSAAPGTLPHGVAWVEALFEQNKIYSPDCYCAPVPAGRDGDRWMWDRLELPARPAASFPFQLPSVDKTLPASLTVWLAGYTDLPASPDHRVEVSLNGSVLGELEWDGKQAITGTFTVTASLLASGDNALALRLAAVPGVSLEGVWLDAFSIRYAHGQATSGDALFFQGEDTPQAYPLYLMNTAGLRAYDVTDPDQPVQLTGVAIGVSGALELGDPPEGGPRRYWVGAESAITAPAGVRLVSRLQSADPAFTGAEYVAITPAGFAPALASLVSLRQAQGLSVVVEDVQAIYDAYSGGRMDPEAIRRYLSDAYAAWDTQPVYVLLLGDGTSDPKRYSPLSFQTFIPPYLAVVDPWAGETAADNRYVAVDGEDILPDMLIGRLPANSLAEAQAMVDKILRYEQNPSAGSWNERALLVADDADGGGNFPGVSEAVRSALFTGKNQAYPLYYDPEAVTAGAMRQEVLNRWNAGSRFIMYTGHASVHQWAVERFFHSDDIPQLGSTGRLPVLLEMTCFTGSFQLPASPSLDEALLRYPQAGAVAVWGSTGLGISTGHLELAQGFLGSFLVDGQPGLGAAALAGKLRLAAKDPAHNDLIETFTLFGDPAMQVHMDAGAPTVYLPLMAH